MQFASGKQGNLHPAVLRNILKPKATKLGEAHHDLVGEICIGVCLART